MSYESQAGAVLFAIRLDVIATFYSSVLGLIEVNRDHDHIVLESPGFQLVVHRTSDELLSPGIAAPAVRRAMAAFKPVFFVPSLENVRALVEVHEGTMDPSEKEWSFSGIPVCDAVDPEGNVIQFREIRQRN